MTESAKFQWIRLLWLYSAAMWVVWGLSARGPSNWFIFAVLYVIIGVRSAAGPVTRTDGLKVVKTGGSFLTNPGTRMTVAVLAAIHSTIVPLIQRL
jgi:hypothetical protein